MQLVAEPGCCEHEKCCENFAHIHHLDFFVSSEARHVKPTADGE